MQHISALLALLAASASVIIGFVVWQGERNNPYRKSFLFLSLFVCLWVAGNVLFAVTNGELRFWVALISYSLALLLVVQLAVFSVLFSGTSVKGSVVIAIVVPGVLMAAVAAVPGLIAYGVNEQGIQTNLSMLLLYATFLLVYLVGANVLLIIARFRARLHERRKLDVILAGVGVSAVLGAACNLILPLFGRYEYTLLGPASAVFFIMAIGYAIVKHGLFDVRRAVVRSVAYSLVLGATVGLYFGIAFVISELIGGTFSTTITSAINVAIALFLALVFQPLKRFFDKLTNQIFYRDSYNPEDFFVRLSNKLRSTSDLSELLKGASQEIASTLKAEKAIFLVCYKNGHVKIVGTDIQKRPTRENVKVLQAISYKDDLIYIQDAIDDDHVRVLMKYLGVDVILQLSATKDVQSYLMLGPQRGRRYDHRDLQTLRTISSELTIAIQNALSVQEVKEINETLQERIRDATQELRATNTQLQRLDVAKDEFVSMASHQLRTPLTSVKGYISMVLEGDAGKITGTQRQLLSEAFASSERMVHLINDFLNVSRLQTGKFVLERREVDFGRLVEKEVESLRSTARMHELVLDYRAPASFPHVSIDDGKIRQVIMNFIDNAIYYSREQSVITVSVAREGSDIVFEVRDTGIGVPKSEQARLFTKFYRASNARKQRPDGTGVGLFLAKKVVDAHGGSIVFSSTEGKGSTFGFRLPIEKLRNTASKQADKLKQ